MERIAVSELWARLADVLDRVDNAERVAITRDGEYVAVLLSPDDAAWCMALTDRFRDRLSPFTQPALDGWLDDVLAGADLSDLLVESPVRS